MAYEEGTDTLISNHGFVHIVNDRLILAGSANVPAVTYKPIRPLNDLYGLQSAYIDGQKGQMWPPKSYLIFNTTQVENG
jgi:hypothetical protein